MEGSVVAILCPRHPLRPVAGAISCHTMKVLGDNVVHCRTEGGRPSSCKTQPAKRNSSDQKLLVKTGSRLVTKDSGKLCSCTMSLKKACATIVMKCAALESRSTTERITDLPCTLGRLFMKSMEISAHTWDGTCSDSSKPAGKRCSDLLCWHMVQVRTSSSTALRSRETWKSR